MGMINPIQGPTPQITPPRISGAGKQEPASSKTKFGEMLRNCVERVEKDQQASTAAVEDLLSGKTQDVLPAVAAAAKADLSFKLLIGVRNKVIEAYKQTMNMQI